MASTDFSPLKTRENNFEVLFLFSFGLIGLSSMTDIASNYSAALHYGTNIFLQWQMYSSDYLLIKF